MASGIIGTMASGFLLFYAGFSGTMASGISKAQLFLPLSVDPAEIELVNKDCVRGVYFNKSELEAFRDNRFYVPGKLNWLSEPHKDVPWIDFASFHLELDQHLEKKKSPLCWMRYPNGDLEVCFVVWWG